MENGGSRQVSSHDPRPGPFQGHCSTNPQGSPAGKGLGPGGGGKILQRKARVGTEEGGGEVCGLEERPKGGWGRGRRRRKERAIPGGDRARQWGRQTDQRKEGGWGGREESPRSARQTEAGAGGIGLGAGGPEPAALRRGGHRGCDAGLTMAPRRAASDARAGGVGRAAASLPPLASRRVWLGDSSGRGGGSARSGSQAAGPSQGGPRRPPLPAPPFSARLRLRAGPPAGTPSPAWSLSAASPTSSADLSPSPATRFLLRPAFQWVAWTLALGCPPCRGCPSFPASALLPVGSV